MSHELLKQSIPVHGVVPATPVESPGAPDAVTHVAPARPGAPALPVADGLPVGDGSLPAWQRPSHGEARWPVALTIVIAIGLQAALPAQLSLHPTWLLPAIESLILALLVAANPYRINREHPVLRLVSLFVVVVASIANGWSAVRLIEQLINGVSNLDGAHIQALQAPQLLASGGAIWATNVIVFALWYWEFDRGGPAARAAARQTMPDFLFAQMQSPHLAPANWHATFVDYLYLSFTNATAFSPTDTLPLSRWAKMMMLLQSAISLVAVALVIARAVNILK